MLPQLCKRNLGGLLLAAFTAGTLVVPAVSAQSTAKKPAHKRTTSSHSSTHKTTVAAHPKSTSTTKTSTSTSKSSKHRKAKSKKVRGQAAPTSDRITEIQQALAQKGAFTGTPSGKWDDDTVAAMKKFQSSNGLNPSGKLDAPTLQKLGLGSEVAGVAAPTPPPNATANRLRSPAALSSDPSN